MAKSLAAEVIVTDLNDQLWLERAPLCRALRRPAARTPPRLAAKARRCDQGFKLRRQRRLFLLLDRGGEANMVQRSVVIKQAEQQRADGLLSVQFVCGIAKPADHAIGAAEFLDLLHALAIAGLIGQVNALG